MQNISTQNEINVEELKNEIKKLKLIITDKEINIVSLEASFFY
jgi:hypothetical protein